MSRQIHLWIHKEVIDEWSKFYGYINCALFKKKDWDKWKSPFPRVCKYLSLFQRLSLAFQRDFREVIVQLSVLRAEI